MGADGSISLKKTHTLPSVDEKLGEEEGSQGTSKEKNGVQKVSWTDDVADYKE